MYLKSIVRTAVTLGLATSLLTGCTRSVSDVDAAGKTHHPVFPEAASAVRPEGTLLTRDRLDLLSAGLTKAQLYELIGTPHFKEGSFGVKEWDYIIRFKQGAGIQTCQMKVLFDKNMRAQSYHFLPENCLREQTKKTQPAVRTQKVFAAEMLFNFDSAALSPAGKRQISDFASELRPVLTSDTRIDVKGYTDRLGSPSYNHSLSQRRAQVIKAHLVENGVGINQIRTSGEGAADPVVDCPMMPKSELITCLAANRRVVIEVVQ